jgi:hypothetical protein
MTGPDQIKSENKGKNIRSKANDVYSEENRAAFKFISISTTLTQFSSSWFRV